MGKYPIYKTDNEIRRRWCEDCENKYNGKRKCPNCDSTNTAIDEVTIRVPKRKL